MPAEIRLPAIEIRQGPKRRLYSFAVDGKQLHDFAAVSRLRREESAPVGYQRPEVLSHVSEIRNYVESKDPMIPNALVVAFDERVRFEPLKLPKEAAPFSQHGHLVIPVNAAEADAEKPGWIVDGQQRAAAIRDAQVGSFPVCVTAFITGDEQEQREQFILVNSTKPLPRSLIYELLPNTTAKLPSLLQKRRFPARLCERLNYEGDSPFRGRIQTPTNPEGTIKDNSILRMIENSLSDGVLYRFRDPDGGSGDDDKMFVTLCVFWDAVRRAWPREWNLPPRKSRLTHGAGIVSLGFVMDAIADRDRRSALVDAKRFEAGLAKIAPECRWSEGFWDFGPGQQRKWNEIQNTSKDIQLLANYLLVHLRQ